ncbi:hypothetical protein [Oceanimonas baumannii]|uniref:Uncharacterized protein n=1 Tax=Oceanimonas baumannii TaxID=129578 RepID=A0A235CP77_9GAMM|nr:hypothetical protein [Oceanimonas baumannii]OYD26373.1 hypothetical protein B6S09_02000 [Oceanimonas baumannii]TDW61966.1 hypothetical protein LY04_00011 [Oceanimonas baumannii]
MNKKEQVKWLKTQKKGFFRHVLSYGLAFCVPLIFGGAFVQHGFYLDLSPFTSWRVYLMTMLGAVFIAGWDWLIKTRQYKKHKEKLAHKALS